MNAKQYQTVIPGELRDTVARHARAVIEGDEASAEGWVEGSALEGHRAACKSAAGIRPLKNFELIAHARLGFQFIVKVRFEGAGGSLALQVRWRLQSETRWRIVEVENLNEHSPWRRPDKTDPISADKTGPVLQDKPN